MENKNTNGKIQELHSLFKTCLDILRNDAEHLIGDEALNELSPFLILKQVEKHILNGSIDIYNLEYYNEGIYDYGKEEIIKIIEYVKFSKFVEYVKIKENEGNIKNLFENFIWNQILSKHPKFKDVFEDGKKSFIKESKTIKKIVLALGEIDFDNYDLDILGEAYESIFVDAVFGAGSNKKSELGQFFTPPKVKKLLVNLVDPKVKENGEIESVLDPSSGTGGILNTVIKHYYSKIQDKDNLRKQLVDKIYGIEIKGKIFNLCMSNMLINTGEILPKVICADSIRQFHNIKVDNIIANPPFSVTIKYEDLLSSLGSIEILDDYIPIKAGGKNSEMLFLQMMIHCLNINGRCATVMLDGQKIYGSSSGYDKVREYLMRSCDLHGVILCPNGTFTSTNSKTCILFFTKKKERAEVLEISGTKRNLKFLDSKTHATENVKFYNFNPNTGEKEFIKEVSIDEIANRKYSLNHNEYQIIEERKKVIGNIEWKELGEVFKLNGNGKTNSSDITNSGEYPFYKASCNNPSGTHNSYDFDESEYLLFIKSGGCSLKPLSYNYGIGKVFPVYGRCAANIAVFQLLPITNNNFRYLTYYLNFSQLKIQELAKYSSNNGNVDMKELIKFKFPVPTIEKQQEIVKFLDSLFTEKYNLQSFTEYYGNGDLFRILLDEKYSTFKNLAEWYYQSEQMHQQIDFYKNNKIKYLDLVEETLKKSEWKELGEVCNFKNGKGIKKEDLIKGEYPVIGGGKKPLGYHNEYNTEENTILCASSGSAGYISRYNTKVWASDCFSIKSKNTNIVLGEYIYYYLLYIQDKIYSLATGAAQVHVYSRDIEKLKIPVPTLEKQKEIVNYVDSKNDIIKQIEMEIEFNRILAHTFLQDIITHIEEEQTERVKEEDEDILLIETEEVVPVVKPKLKLKVKKEENKLEEVVPVVKPKPKLKLKVKKEDK
jgi:type I restriction-modification system DNA methylase subunit/restriction endonuclease S subunit